MSNMTSAEFLKKIGARPLTEEEAKTFHILRMQENNASGISSIIDELEKEIAEGK